MPNLVTYLNPTSLVEWYVVRCSSKNEYQKGIMCLKVSNMSEKVTIKTHVPYFTWWLSFQFPEILSWFIAISEHPLFDLPLKKNKNTAFCQQRRLVESGFQVQVELLDDKSPVITKGPTSNFGTTGSGNNNSKPLHEAARSSTSGTDTVAEESDNIFTGVVLQLSVSWHRFLLFAFQWKN